MNLKNRIGFLVLLLVVVLGWSSGASAVPVQWTVAEGGNGHWYDRIHQGLLWDEARSDAEARGGYLATPTSSAEWNFMKASVLQSEGFMAWLGGYQTQPEGGWNWVTGEAWSFTAWASGEPFDTGGEDYLLTWFPDGSNWNDHYDSQFEYYIEYDTNPIPEPNTALLLALGITGLAARQRQHRRSTTRRN